MWRDAEIIALTKQLEGKLANKQIQTELAEAQQKLQDDLSLSRRLMLVVNS
ncbi:hypothetical protein OK016_00455 [Vibrio chagasii]|nr:hypothetical protein [Vibrio chagasii]